MASKRPKRQSKQSPKDAWADKLEEAEREHELTRKKKPKAKAVPRENPPDQADKNSPSPKTPAVMDPPKSSAAKSTPKTPVTKNTLSTLALFSKYYNKWFVALENSFPWTSNQSAAKKASVNARVLVRLVKKQAGSNYTEVTLEAEGDWGPKQVFRVMNHRDIIGVDNQL